MELQLIDCEQNSPEWIQARCGVVTASMFSAVMAKGEGKTRRKYLLRLVGEKLAGRPFDSYSNADMERGHALEAEARDLYSMVTENEVKQMGFMKRGEVGYSPDGLIGKDGLLEIKTKDYHLHLECILSGKVPAEHKKQCQGGLWVSGRQWLDFCSYSPGLPLFIERVQRDERFIAEIKFEVDRFLVDINTAIAQVQQYKRAA